MCYTRKDQRFEEDIRTLRVKEEARGQREKSARPAGREPEKDKPLTEKVKELVGAK
jgi:hypothetical protein